MLSKLARVLRRPAKRVRLDLRVCLRAGIAVAVLLATDDEVDEDESVLVSVVVEGDL